MKKIIPLSLIVFVLDQLVKLIIIVNINLNTSVTVIKNFFYISYVRNYGAAFSILDGNRIFLIFISFIALMCIYQFFIKNKKLNKFDIITFSLLYGGIVGNLYDRVVRGYVVDFLDFYIFNYSFPIFNVADICIVVSMFLIVLDSLWGDKDADSCRK